MIILLNWLHGLPNWFSLYPNSFFFFLFSVAYSTVLDAVEYYKAWSIKRLSKTQSKVFPEKVLDESIHLKDKDHEMFKQEKIPYKSELASTPSPSGFGSSPFSIDESAVQEVMSLNQSPLRTHYGVGQEHFLSQGSGLEQVEDSIKNMNQKQKKNNSFFK